MVMCSIDGCNRPVRCRGLCIAHYSQYRREHATPRGACSVDGCTRPILAKGFCAMHYARFHKHGDPSILKCHKVSDSCAVEGCPNHPVALNLCDKHYRRFKKHGDPLTTLHAPDGSGYLLHGYHIIRNKSIQVREHRVIMEQHLGRPLLPTEFVHHVNGDRADNRIENLILMTPSEHSGLHHPKRPENTVTHKYCPCCKQTLPRSDFHKNRARSDGLGVYCSNCIKLKERAA